MVCRPESVQLLIGPGEPFTRLPCVPLLAEPRPHDQELSGLARALAGGQDLIDRERRLCVAISHVLCHGRDGLEDLAGVYRLEPEPDQLLLGNFAKVGRGLDADGIYQLENAADV